MAANIVGLASFPKSGNTWFRILPANWRAEREQPVDINNIAEPGGDMTSPESFDEATLLCSGVMDAEEIDGLRPAVYGMLADEAEGSWYIKVHEAYRRNANGEPFFAGKAVIAAIHLVRDPRDVSPRHWHAISEPQSTKPFESSIRSVQCWRPHRTVRRCN